MKIVICMLRCSLISELKTDLKTILLPLFLPRMISQTFPVEAQRVTKRERGKEKRWRPVWHHSPAQTWLRPPTPPKTTQQKQRRVNSSSSIKNTFLLKKFYNVLDSTLDLVPDPALVPNVSIDDLKQMKVGNPFTGPPLMQPLVVVFIHFISLHLY